MDRLATWNKKVRLIIFFSCLLIGRFSKVGKSQAFSSGSLLITYRNQFFGAFHQGNIYPDAWGETLDDPKL
jgi:hypothetical protein